MGALVRFAHYNESEAFVGRIDCVDQARDS